MRVLATILSVAMLVSSSISVLALEQEVPSDDVIITCWGDSMPNYMCDDMHAPTGQPNYMQQALGSNATLVDLAAGAHSTTDIAKLMGQGNHCLSHSRTM